MPENRIVVNPLVHKLSKEKATIPIAGYIGSTEQGKVRIYRDLSLQVYLDIPQEEVVEFIEGEAPEHSARLFFRTAATVSFTKTFRLAGAVSFHKSATFTVDELKRTLLTFRIRQTHSACKCQGDHGAEQRQKGGGGIGLGGGGILLPPEWCELNCEQWLSICDELSIWERIWCYVDYILCILGCTGQPGRGPVIE